MAAVAVLATFGASAPHFGDNAQRWRGLMA